MAYFKDKFSLIVDSDRNIDLFRLSKGNIIRYHFARIEERVDEKTIVKGILEEFDVSIDGNDRIFLVYQDKSFHLILTLIDKDEGMESFKLTKEPIPEIHYLNLFLIEDNPHIVYALPMQPGGKEYRIYHHFYQDEWITNLVDHIEVKEFLNPIGLFNGDERTFIAYYDKEEGEEIYLRELDLEEGKWKGKIKLTDDNTDKLFLDILLIESKLHLSYCQYEDGNLQVKYKRFNYENDSVEKEVEETLSNPENPQDPVLLYYDNKLWLGWIEHDNVLSRFSEDFGKSWSPIYLWNESKGKSIVRYKYLELGAKDKILNYSFGKIEPEIEFIGFGPLVNTTEVPLKKKAYPIF